MLPRPLTLAAFTVSALALSVAHAGEPPTARIMVNPVPAKAGPPYPPLADGGPNIVGNELRLDAGGVRVWVEVQLADWDPNGDGSPGASYFQVEVDQSGLWDADIDGDGDVTNDGDQEDIPYALAPCTFDSDCWAAFGETLPPDMDCQTGACRPVYTAKDGGRADGWCARIDPFGPACSCGSTPFITESLWQVQGCYEVERPDDGTVRWGATAVYDVPAGAKGKYTVELDTETTFLALAPTQTAEIPSLSETGFVIHVLTGRCCYAIGTVNEGCTDSVTRAECATSPQPFRFTHGSQCPPGGPECEPVKVSCCNGDPFEPCQEDVPISECQCDGCASDQFRTCAELNCPRKAIPTASGWGAAILILLVMAGAKVMFHTSAPAPEQ